MTEQLTITLQNLEGEFKMFTEQEKETANSILSIVQNLEDEAEAKEFFRLYMKALNNANASIFADQIDEESIRELVSMVDARF